MSKYRKKPVVIEAMQYRPGPGGNCEEVGRFVGQPTDDHYDHLCGTETEWFIQTLEGEMTASPGDFIIRGVQGEFYPCKPDIFAATYEPAEASPADDRLLAHQAHGYEGDTRALETLPDRVSAEAELAQARAAIAQVQALIDRDSPVVSKASLRDALTPTTGTEQQS